MKNIFNGSPPMGRYGYAFPALAGLAALLLGVLIHASYPHLKPVLFSGENIRSGSFLLAGVYGKAITWDMPLYNTLASLWLNLGISPFYFLLASGAGMYLLVFFTAARLRGRKAGAAALALLVVFGLTSGRDIEQMFYSFFLMLSLALLLLRRRENTPANNVLAGLAIGASMLVRTPLFLLPPLVVGCDWLCGAGRGRGFLLRSAVFLAASYVLLLPWAAVRYPLTGKISLFDDRRAACNLITTARGGIYTIATDAYRLAPEYSGREMEYFFRQVKAAPGFYALTVIRRLGRIFLFNPLVFGVFLAALWA
ncbi:MAG TPA: hypothetical protein PKI19_11385, partial [Elusimicrobiales bacterium]|nr:hypothetical protein [Elusimicrobiales bacterium]